MAVKFEDVAAAALDMAPLLLAEWLGGGRKGHEWLGERKSNGGPGDSWSVNLNTGAFAHFAGPEKGGDLVALYAALNHIDQLPALKAVAGMVGVTDGRAPKLLPRTKAPESLSEPIPDDAPQPEAHPTLGEASATYRYGRAFWITRYDLADGKKEFRPHTWRHGKWFTIAYGGQKPPYNANLLAKRPEAPVLIVEGEKCADIASVTLKRYVCMTWAGGAQAIEGTDWSCLKGRDVIIWPDADDPGRKAAAWLGGELAGVAALVRIVQPNGQALGWDIADAVGEGMSPLEIANWCAAHIVDKITTKPTPAAAAQLDAKPSVQTPEDLGDAAAEPAIDPPPPDAEFLPLAERQRSKNYPDGQAPQSAVLSWQSLPVRTNDKGIPHATLSNASLIIQYHEEFKDKIWFDSFRGKVFHTLHGVPKQWTDADDRRVTAWIQQRLELPKFTLMTVHEAVLHAAECNQRNSLTDWLDSLKWDGVERLDTWLFDCLGATRNAYNDAVARNWPISMVARAYDPGCQVDTMPVLEGKMGRGKSSFLRILADPWFAAVQIAFGEKDFFQAIQGKWLIEVPDMSGFSRREHTQIIATISNQNDVYRQSHGRNTEDHQRVTIFAATSENDEYLQESRGRRRYWPLVCGDINLEALRAQREQIFAEAVVKYRAGAQWYEMPEETDAEQAARASRDIWTDRVLNYAELYGDNKLTSAVLLENAIKMDTDRMDDGAKKRVYRIMMEAGYKQLHSRKERYWKKTTTEQDK
jgi:putative DNA primase/helicase